MELLEFKNAAAVYSQLGRLEPDNEAWPECHSKALALADPSPYEVRPPAALPLLTSCSAIAPVIVHCGTSML